MSSRASHRYSLLQDSDALHSGSIAALACLLSAGLVYLYYLLRVIRVARNTSTTPTISQCVLLFGKYSPDGKLDQDFQARIDRVIELLKQQTPIALILLGGGPSGQPTEAEVAHRALQQHRLPASLTVHLELQSRDTLQNLRNARQLLKQLGHDGSTVTLLTSRYHLDRCLMFARQLGFNAVPCAAEAKLDLHPGMLLRLCAEAGYVCWVEVGTRWARLIGHQRMLAKVT